MEQTEVEYRTQVQFLTWCTSQGGMWTEDCERLGAGGRDGRAGVAGAGERSGDNRRWSTEGDGGSNTPKGE